MPSDQAFIIKMRTYVQFVPQIVLPSANSTLELHRFVHRVLYKHDFSQHLSRSSLLPFRLVLKVPASATRPRRRREIHNLNVPRPSFPPFQENC